MPNGPVVEYPCCGAVPVPRQWEIVNIDIPGNDYCTTCDQWSPLSSYILDPQESAGCGHWELFGKTGPCGSGMDFILGAVPNTDPCTIALTLDMELNYVTKVNVLFVNNNIRDALSESIVLTLSSSSDDQCDWTGTTVTIRAVPSSLSAFAEGKAGCLPSRCEAPGSASGAVQQPKISKPNEDARPQLECKCTCECEGCGGGGGCGCDGGCDGSAGGGQTPVYGGVEGIYRGWWPVIPGPFPVGLSNGNLQALWCPPEASRLDVKPGFTYNSIGGSTTNYGNNVSSNLSPKVTDAVTSAVLRTASGAQYKFMKNASTGEYCPPPGLKIELVKNGDGTWTATYPSGSSIQFASNGRVSYLANSADARWTISHDGGGKPQSIESPVGRRWTLTYSGSNIQTLKDPGGRVTSMTVDGSGNLSKMVWPDGSTKTLQYDASDLLQAYVDPEGNRTTYGYSHTFDRSGMVESIETPEGHRTTLTWLNWLQTRFTDARGNISTIGYTTGRNINSIHNPLGEIATYAWKSNQLRSFQNPAGETWTLSYDSSLTTDDGRLVSMKTPLGFVTSLSYESSSWSDFRLKDAENPLGNRATSAWNGHQPSASIDALGYRTTFTQNSRGQHESTKTPLGFIYTNVYDSSTGNKTATINPLGARNSQSYNTYGQVESMTNALGYVTSMMHDLANREIARINALGAVTSFGHDLNGHIISVQNAVGEISTTQYSTDGEVEATINPLGQRTTYIRDANGQIETVIDALNCRTTITRNALGQEIAVQNARGFVTTTNYDSFGEVESTQDALGYLTTQIRDADNRHIATVNPRGARLTNVLDAAGQLSATVNPLGHRTTFSRDAAGREIAMQNAMGFVSSTIHDAMGRVEASQNALGYFTTFSYSAASEQVAVIDGNGNRSTTIYDAASQVIGVENALGYITSTLRDPVGRPAALQNARGYFYTMTLDPLGRQVELIDPIARITTTGYDAVGSQNLRIDARGFATTYTNDALGRETYRLYPNGSRVTWGWDCVGNRTQMQDITGFYTSTYDARDSLETATSPTNQTVSYGWDPVFNRRHMDAPGVGRITYSHDRANQLEWLINPYNERTTFTHDTIGRRKLKELANGSRASLTYDSADQLTQLYNLKSDDSVISGYDYGYDRASNKTSVREADSSRATWTYDQAYQLTNEDRSGSNPYNITHDWDSVGNRLVKNADGVRTTGVYDAGNQIETIEDIDGLHTFVFDQNGNQQVVKFSNGQRTTRVWDYENRNTLVQTLNGCRATSMYNAINRRVQKTYEAETARYLWDIQNDTYLSESDDWGNLNAFYSNEPIRFGPILSQRRNSASSFYHFDSQQSTRQLTNVNETVSDSAVYAAFGETVASSGSTVNPFRFSGAVGYYLNVETNDFYIRERAYSPGLGVWQSIDSEFPEGFSLQPGISSFGQYRIKDILFANPVDPNVYRYAFNSPIEFIDPSGNFGLCVLVVIAVGGLVLVSSTGCDIPQSSIRKKPYVPPPNTKQFKCVSMSKYFEDRNMEPPVHPGPAYIGDPSPYKWELTTIHVCYASCRMCNRGNINNCQICCEGCIALIGPEIRDKGACAAGCVGA